MVDADAQASLPNSVQMPQWALLATLHRPTDRNETVLLFKRVNALSAGALPPERRTGAPSKRP